MSLLMVGLSHASAPLSLLERVAVPAGERAHVLGELLGGFGVTEAVLVSTCNRVEVYASADEPGAGAAQVADVLARRAGLSSAALMQCAVVRHGVDAVHHLFTVAAGLDSLVVGDEQVLGQVRAAYAASAAAGAAGPVLHTLLQQALRVGKRVRTETALTRVGASTVQASLQRAVTVLAASAAPGDRGRSMGTVGPAHATAAGTTDGTADRSAGQVAAGIVGGGPAVGGDLRGRRAVVLGAGAMSALAVARLQQLGAAQVLLVNRTPSRASALAATASCHSVRAITPEELPAALAGADVVVAATGSPQALVSAQVLSEALRRRPAHRGPVVVCDLGMPRNVDAAVGDVAGAVLVDLEALGRDHEVVAAAADVSAARNIVADQLSAYVVREAARTSAARGHAAGGGCAEVMCPAGGQGGPVSRVVDATTPRPRRPGCLRATGI